MKQGVSRKRRNKSFCEGNDRKTAIVTTQTEAIKIAREIAINQKSEVVIHRPDGTIRDKDSYGNDPNPPKDKGH